MIVTVAELGKTSLYPEIINKITRNDNSAAELQILAAEEYAKSFLFKYDLNAIFGTETEPPTHKSELIKRIVKTIASYYLVRMANPNVQIELFRADFEDVKTLLEDMRDGKNNSGLPYATDNTTTPEDEGNSDIHFSSNPKRTNHF